MKDESLRVKEWRKKNAKLCPQCKETHILPESKTCKKCAIENRSKLSKLTTLGEVKAIGIKKHYHPSWMFSRIRTLCRSWNQHLEHKCQKCGYDYHVEFAHKKAITDFPDSTTLGEINDSSNIMILCPNCHWEYDHPET